MSWVCAGVLGKAVNLMAISRIVILVCTSKQKSLVPMWQTEIFSQQQVVWHFKVPHQDQNFTHEPESPLYVVLLPLWSIFGLLDNFSEHLLNIFAPQWQIWEGDFPPFSALRSSHSLLTFRTNNIYVTLLQSLCIRETSKNPLGFSHIPSHRKTIWMRAVEEGLEVSSEASAVSESDTCNTCLGTRQHLWKNVLSLLGLSWFGLADTVWFHCDW